MTAERPRWPPIVCPSCLGPLAWSEREAVCERERVAYPVADGIPRLIVPASRERVSGFLERYLAVRHDEGWTEDDPDALLALPYRDLTGRRAWMWRVRARGLDALRRALGRELGGRRLRVCERGAGVAWLSYRLALDGHDAVATDVNVDPRDGLGAARHYARAGVRVTALAAEMDRVPLASGSCDVVVNAASLHYARDLGAAAREAARLLVPGGLFAILDSPVYEDPRSGDAMVAEWRERLASRYGIRTETPDSGYLVRGDLERVLRESGFDRLAFEAHWMGWRWTAGYLKARLRGAREPARLPLVTARRVE